MPTSSDTPRWVVLAPGSLTDVQRAVAAYLDETFDGDDERRALFAVVPGAARHHVVAGRGDAIAGSETAVAESMSETLTGQVYAAELDEPYVLVFEQGGHRRTDRRDVRTLAAELGCPLAPEPAVVRRPAKARSVAVIEGAPIDVVRRALAKAHRSDQPPASLRFDEMADGRILISSATGSVGFAAMNVTERVAGARATAVIATPDLSNFTVMDVEAGEMRGRFQLPLDVADPDARPDVRGQTEPHRILDALSIPARLLTG